MLTLLSPDEIRMEKNETWRPANSGIFPPSKTEKKRQEETIWMAKSV